MIFEFKNNHIPECGTPPKYSTKDWKVKVAETRDGEQILMACNRSTGRFQFHLGDAGWENIQYLDRHCLLSDEETLIISKYASRFMARS